MSSVALFALGAVVTALVALGVSLPIYGAILDGRYQAERKTDELRELRTTRPTDRPAA